GQLRQAGGEVARGHVEERADTGQAGRGDRRRASGDIRPLDVDLGVHRGQVERERGRRRRREVQQGVQVTGRAREADADQTGQRTVLGKFSHRVVGVGEGQTSVVVRIVERGREVRLEV